MPSTRRTQLWLATGAIAALAATGAAIAGAATGDSSPTTTPAASSDVASAAADAQDPAASSGDAAAPADVRDPAALEHGPDETLLTGTAAEQVTAAALAAVPGGTVIRVETDSAGSPYEAHVTKADGSQVTLKLDESFTVTATEEGFGGGGPRGHGPRDQADAESDEPAAS
jgi:hypothetical protein